MSDTVQVNVEDGVAVVRVDDGKMNALSHEAIEQLHGALDTAREQAGSLCIIGNARALSAGFDLAVMTAGADPARGLVRAGAEFLMRLYGHPQPTVVAVTGHALAAGALVLLAADARVAVDRPAKIGLNEVAIGLALPVFAIELARDRMSKRAFTRATLQAEIFDPAGAIDAGFVDRVVPETECEGEAIAEARRLAALPAGAYAVTKQSTRRRTIDHVLATLADDMDRLVPPTS